MARFKNLPRDARADAPLWGQLVGLPPNCTVQIEAATRDDMGQMWRSEAVYRASAEGVIDLAQGRNRSKRPGQARMRTACTGPCSL